jgi:hypothetical protein
LRVQFGGQQDPSTLLPAGDTADPGEDVAVCPGSYLYAWVNHSFGAGDVIDGRISDSAGVLYTASVPVDPQAQRFWIGAPIMNAGPHTLLVRLAGSDVTAEWTVNVTC